MIHLDFVFDPETSGPSGPNPDLWPDECKLGAFEGCQKIEINGQDFSEPLPILAFARALKMGAKRFLTSTKAEFEFNDLSSPWTIHFRLQKNQVEVSDQRGKATLAKDLFIKEALGYAARVFDACTSRCPEMAQNEFIVAWWNDENYSCATYEPKSTDRRTLTPNNPFYVSGP